MIEAHGTWSTPPAEADESIPPTATVYTSHFMDTDVVEELSRVIKTRLNKRHALVVSNCTAACHTSLAALGIGPGDEVICPAISDYATLFCILARGATPVFADVDPANGLISHSTIGTVLSSHTAAIVVVHFWGITCDMEPILQIAESEHIPVIEDCCQAPFASYRGQLTGSFGDISVLGFSKEKHWASDSGGVIVTDNDEIAEKAYRFAIARGSYWKSGYGRVHESLGFNYRPSTLAVTAALAQYRHLDGILVRRRQAVSILNQGLATLHGLTLPAIPEGGDNVAWMYHFRLDDMLIDHLASLSKNLRAAGLPGIDSARYYLLPEACRGAIDEAGQSSLLGSPAAWDEARRYLARTLRWVMEDYSPPDMAFNLVALISDRLNSYREQHDGCFD